MAIQFARLAYVSRSQGKNACCKSAYNARAQITDLTQGVTYDFRRIQDKAFHAILLPNNVNEKFKNLETLMNAVEKAERRTNSQLLKEYVLALPDEETISLEDRIELVKQFVDAKQFVQEGLAVQIDIHKPHDEEKNWHAHLLTTTRRFTEDGNHLGFKARDLDAKVKGGRDNTYVERDALTDGELWRNIQNSFFEEKGLDLRVDATSETPEFHLGPVRMRGFISQAAQFHEERKAR